MKPAVRNPRVAVAADTAAQAYPAAADAPFHPSESFPECPFRNVSVRPNHAYGMVRRLLRDLGLDAERFNTPAWNPIGQLVQPGAKIVIKPNWVLHENLGKGGTDCLVTHASILRAVLDYAILARSREIVIGDAPIQDCDFERLQALGFREVVEFCAAGGVPVRVVDFRRTVLEERGHSVRVHEDRRPLDEYVVVDLGSRSLLEPISAGASRFRVTKYDPRRMAANQQPGVHRYLIAKDVLDADLVINLPKLKTHKKAGITAALKNLVGINGNKDYLPHHRKGPASAGGDNYPRFTPLKYAAEQLFDLANRHMDRPGVYSLLHRLIYALLVLDMKLGGTGDVEGGWYGNDTVWRMCLDLNRALLYCDRAGRLQDQPQRAVLQIADGIVAGEGNGPLSSSPHAMGLLVAGLNPAAVDWIAALLMGFDPSRIPIISNAFQNLQLPIALFAPDGIECVVNGQAAPASELPAKWGQRLEPAAGWRNHCELGPKANP